MCKPLGEIAVDEIWIKLHLTKISLVQSVNFISCIFSPKGPTEILETIFHNFLSKIYEAHILIWCWRRSKLAQVFVLLFRMSLAHFTNSWLDTCKWVLWQSTVKIQMKGYIMCTILFSKINKFLDRNTMWFWNLWSLKLHIESSTAYTIKLDGK